MNVIDYFYPILSRILTRNLCIIHFTEQKTTKVSERIERAGSKELPVNDES